MKVRVFGAWALAASLVTLTACGSSTPVDTTPTPTPVVRTETFTGSVDVMGVDIHPFTLAATGQVDITLTAAGPPATIQMGLGVGVPSGTTCPLLTGGVTVVAAGTAPQLSGTIPAGPYCVEVFDVGNQLASITYTVTVTHP